MAARMISGSDTGWLMCGCIQTSVTGRPAAQGTPGAARAGWPALPPVLPHHPHRRALPRDAALAAVIDTDTALAHFTAARG